MHNLSFNSMTILIINTWQNCGQQNCTWNSEEVGVVIDSPPPSPGWCLCNEVMISNVVPSLSARQQLGHTTHPGSNFTRAESTALV